MNSKIIIGIALSRDHAESMVEWLRDAGFRSPDVSVLFPDTSGADQVAVAKGPKCLPPLGALEWLAGLGAVLVPGAGLFVAAGPVLGALTRAAADGIAGALGFFGLSEGVAHRFAGRVHAGGVLVSVHVETEREAQLARFILEQSGAEAIAWSDEHEAFCPATGAAVDTYRDADRELETALR